MWQAGFPQGDMQHVNVCLQAGRKRLRKSCREQENEEEEGARNVGNENQRVPGLSVTGDSRECAARGTPVSITNTAPPSLPLRPPSRGPAVKSTIPLV